MVEGLCNYHAGKLEHMPYHHSTTAQIDAYSSMYEHRGMSLSGKASPEETIHCKKK